MNHGKVQIWIVQDELRAAEALQFPTQAVPEVDDGRAKVLSADAGELGRQCHSRAYPLQVVSFCLSLSAVLVYKNKVYPRGV